MAAPGGTTDPRISQPVETGEDIRPVVAAPRRGLPGWMLLLLAVFAGLILFAVLDSRRRALTSPEAGASPSQSAGFPAPPPLRVPPEAPAPAPAVPSLAPRPAPPATDVDPPIPQVIYVPQPATPQPYVEPAPPPRPISSEPALLVDAGAPPMSAPASAGSAADAAQAGGSPLVMNVAGARARAGALANRATTVAQGTLIQAVLETAIDSTRPGLARAIVSHNVHGFDGSRILIPRGSRLIGEYHSEIQPGQNRALVNWLRLIRPDGVTIAIGSPSGDPLGRTGIRARVNSHFLERFADAMMQSILDVGVNLAASQATDSAVIIVPGGSAAARQIVPQRQFTPTLKVRQGTSVSIFVARDLDFSGAP